LIRKYIGLKEGEMMELPYRTTKPLAGDALQELKSRLSTAETARSLAQRADRIAVRARLLKDLDAYQRMLDAAKKDQSAKGRGQVEMLQLQVAKLKAQRGY
jgi:hypothetical protein